MKYTLKILFFIILHHNANIIQSTRVLAKISLMIINQDLPLFINHKYREKNSVYFINVYLSSNFNELSNGDVY